MIQWKQLTVDWSTFPMQSDITSFDRKGEVYVTLTNESFKHDDKLYRVCIVDHRRSKTKEFIRWSESLHTLPSEYGPYVYARGRKVYVGALLKNVREGEPNYEN